MITDSRAAELGGVSSNAVPDTVALQARRYAHPQFEGRMVVRLVRENLAEVEDLSLGVLGFAPDGAAGVGHVRNRAIGFPAWPIITDPANSRHALNLVGDLNRAAKLARSKAGPAKELLDELAGRLGNSAPHFLPTFLEEGARIFLRNDNLSYAMQFFNKAREAERVHGLAIDEERHRQVLLEFALAGALSAKELTNESKTLLERHAPADALELFLKFNIDRVRGGLPPYAGLPTDMRRLIRAAGADRLEVETGLLSALLGSPAIEHAPTVFWDGYSKPLIQLAKRDESVRQTLLGMAPDRMRPDMWIDVLEATGIADELRSGNHDAAAWAERYIRMLQDQWNADYPRKLCLLLRQLPGLRGTTVTLSNNLWRLEPEVLDALLAAGARVVFEEDPGWRKLDFRRWAAQQERPDLEHLARSEHAALGLENMGLMIGQGHLHLLLSHSGTRELLGRWAAPRLGKDATALEVAAELKRLRPLFTSEGRAAYPDQFAAFVSHLDAPRLLADALRDGVLTEYTWPELEKAAAELGDDVTLHESWPAVGVARNGHVIWVEGDRRVAEATFTIPKGFRPEDWRYVLVDGVTGCYYRDSSYDEWFVWSNDPAHPHKASYVWRIPRSAQSFPVASGRLIGQRVLRVGDQESPFNQLKQVLHDGNTYWVDGDGIREVDPETGNPGRESLPSGLAELVEPHLRDGWKLLASTLLWAPVTVPGSPLPQKEGVHGWVVLSREGDRRFLGIDGYRLDAGPDGGFFTARVRRPGGGYWLVDESNGLHRDPTGERFLSTSDALGQPHLLSRLPRVGWHHLQVRDEAASAGLRSVTPEMATALLAATPAANQQQGCDADGLNFLLEDTDAEVDEQFITEEARAAAETLLGTADPALVDSVIWLTGRVKRIVDEGRALAREAAEETVPGTFAEWEPSDELAVWNVLGWRSGATTSRSTVLALARRLAGEQVRVKAVHSRLHLLLTHPEVLLACAATPFRERDRIGGAAAAVAAVLDAGLYTPEGCVFDFPHSRNDPFRCETGTLVETPTGAAIALGLDDDRTSVFSPTALGLDDNRMLVFSPTGGVPPHLGGHETTPRHRSRGLSPEALVAAFEKLLSDGPAPWDPARRDRLAEGLGWSPAAAGVLLAGLPNLNCWDNNYLPKPVRELLGLKVTEAAGAREFLKGLGVWVLVELLAAGAQDPVRTVREGLDVEAMIEWWKTWRGDRIQLPEELLAAAAKEFRWGGANSLRELAEQEELDERHLSIWLWAATKVDRSDALGPWLADRFDVIRAGCGKPSPGWNDYTNDGKMRVLLGLSKRTKQTPEGSIVSQGAWTITAARRYDTISWDPAKVTDWETEATLAAGIPEDLDFRDNLLGRISVLTGGFDAIQKDLRSGIPGPQQDPLVSAPRVVAEVSETLGLPEASSRYWLQLLALHNPTDRNVEGWNAWKKTARVEAAAPLLEKGLVLEAKRSRAGRTLFLPGGWQEASSPHLPMEVWKAPFYDLLDTLKVEPKQGVVVPLVPYHQLFVEAWRRYREGDVPGYEELRTERHRRR